MIRSLQGPGLYVTVALVIAAIVAAVLDGKVANLLIGAAMVASSAVIFGVMMDRRIGDAYDSGRSATKRLEEARSIGDVDASD